MAGNPGDDVAGPVTWACTRRSDEKQREADELAEAVKAFRQGGGKIQRIRSGVSGETTGNWKGRGGNLKLKKKRWNDKPIG